MKFGEMITFRKDLFFEGAVQADWFYQPAKAALVAENFVFHGSEYYGAGDLSSPQKFTDTISFTRDIASKAFDDQPGNPLTLAIAGYGTGKSHLAVTLATVLSGKDYQPEAYSHVINNIRILDSKAASEIEGFTSRPNLVLVLNGMRDFNLHYELLRAAQKSLKLYGCDDSNLKKLNRAIETAFRFFERNAESMASEFEAFAPQYGYTDKGARLIERIRSNLGEDEAAFNIINAVYENLNGHAIRWDEGVSATAVLETLMSEYCGISGPFAKIIIIFDEFGRYLEYASSTTTAHSGDSALQQMFECAQNFGGSLQLVNFIQADIKAYLQRVDQSTNISRYIGRYDVSEKYRLSSNLETIFANLIQRTDKEAFEEKVVSWQNEKEAAWKNAFDSLNRWLPTTGIWHDYPKFRKVAVEGIYPLHPFATYMLSKLSDYLQNRSSLMLLSRYIHELSECDVDNGTIPVILPETLLKGDLFTEMLSAEEEGRQVSQHCIRFNNVLRKYEDKLSEESQKILRANLAMRILRCRTENYDDAICGLAMFSGVAVDQVKAELVWLENEYAVLGYDEHAACFDFLEDSSGAHDFKTYFRRVRATIKFNPSILEETAIRELAGVIEPQPSNFSTKHRISTNEWQYEQELFSVTDLSSAFISRCIDDWKKSTTIEKAKGKIIWLYSNNDTPEEVLEKACGYSNTVAGAPIILMQLKDSDGLLESALSDYLTLERMSDDDVRKYERHYNDKLQQTKASISLTFEKLKKARLRFTANGVQPLQNRIANALTEVFEEIYPHAVPFDFDGFASKQPGKARKAFCSIVRLVLSGQVSENTIHSFPVDVRNRFDATLFANSLGSWKIVNTDYQIVPPTNKDALYAYNLIMEKLPEGSTLKLQDVLSTLMSPPFGMNDYEAVYMLTAVFANYSYCMRIVYKDVLYNVSNWANQVIGDSKIDLRAIADSSVKRINAGAVADQFLALFNRINANTDTGNVEALSKELESILRSESIPDALSAQCLLAKNKLQEGNRIIRTWDATIAAALDNYGKLISNRDFYAGLLCIQELKSYKFFGLFAGTSYVISEAQQKQLTTTIADIQSKVNPFLMGWVKEQRCKSVENMGSFKGHMKRLKTLLDELGYQKEAVVCEEVAEKELSNAEAIRNRQEIKRNYVSYLRDYVPQNSTPYVRLLEWKKDFAKLSEGIDKYYDFLGKEAPTMKDAVSARCTEIEEKIESIKDAMNQVWDDLYAIDSLRAVSDLIEDIKYLTLRGIEAKDLEDFADVQAVLMSFLEDVSLMQEEQNNRERFEENYLSLKRKYEETDMEFDVIAVLDGVAKDFLEQLDKKDLMWKNKHLSAVPEDVDALHTWLQDTESLPTYLTPETRREYAAFKEKVNARLSEAKVDSILLSFSSLSPNEKKQCLERMKLMT